MENIILIFLSLIDLVLKDSFFAIFSLVVFTQLLYSVHLLDMMSLFYFSLGVECLFLACKLMLSLTHFVCLIRLRYSYVKITFCLHLRKSFLFSALKYFDNLMLWHILMILLHSDQYKVLVNLFCFFLFFKYFLLIGH